MKKVIYKWMLLISFLVIVLVFVGCSGAKDSVDDLANDIIDEEVPEQAAKEDTTESIPKQEDLDVSDTQMSEESIDAIMEDMDEVVWSSDIPDVFEEFEDGYCIICDNFKESDSNIWMLTYIDVDLENVTDYNKKLEKNNWILEDEVTGFMYAYSKDEYETTVTIGNNEDGSIWYTLYLSHEVSNDSGSDLNHMDSGDVPEGYPGDVPVYESNTSIIIGASEINAGGQMVYSIEIGCDETTEEIVAVLYPYIEELNPNKATKIIMNGNGLLQGGTNDWYYTIRIEAVEYNGKATNILYQVIPVASE